MTFNNTGFPGLECTNSSLSGEKGQWESEQDTDSNSNATSDNSDDPDISSTDFGNAHHNIESESPLLILNNEVSSINQLLNQR